MAISKKASITLALIGIFVGAVSVAAITQHFYPKIDYDFEGEPVEVAYTEIPLMFDTLLLNQEYTYLEYEDLETIAIKVFREGIITIKFKSINEAHFSEFTVQVWDRTESPATLIGSFDMTNTPLTFETEAAEYGYAFIFKTKDVPGAYGTVELDVFFQNPP